jgi:hypothetical protein
MNKEKLENNMFRFNEFVYNLFLPGASILLIFFRYNDLYLAFFGVLLSIWYNVWRLNNGD